jgi:hypothetical protein
VMLIFQLVVYAPMKLQTNGTIINLPSHFIRFLGTSR